MHTRNKLLALTSALLVLGAASLGVRAGQIDGYGLRDYFLDVARGVVTFNGVTVKQVNKFGENQDVDIGTVPETLWSQGALHVPPTAARTHDIASTSAADDGSPGGTGAQTVRVYGLDSSWLEQEEDVTLNGTTNVATANTYTRIFRMKVLTAGSGMTNAGLITATAQTDATVTAAIPIGESQTQMAVWTVPSGKTAYLRTLYTTLNRQGATAGAMAEMELLVRSGLDTATPVLAVKHNFAVAVGGTSNFHQTFESPKTITGPADVELRVTYVSDNNAVLAGGFDCVYE